MSIYYPDDESLSRTIVSEKVTLINKDRIMDKIQSWGWFIAGLICAVVALYLGFQMIFGDVGGFLAWCWKLPVIVVAAMAAIVFTDVGVNGDRPPR